MRKGEAYKPVPPHGTLPRYRHRVYPCRTDACPMPEGYRCKDVWAAYMREYRARRP